MSASHPPLPPGSRRSRLRDADGETDNIVGLWPRERLIKMDERFCEAVREALAARPAPTDCEQSRS